VSIAKVSSRILSCLVFRSFRGVTCTIVALDTMSAIAAMSDANVIVRIMSRTTDVTIRSVSSVFRGPDLTWDKGPTGEGCMHVFQHLTPQKQEEGL